MNMRLLRAKPVAMALLALFCLAFFHCKSSSASMVRAVVLEHSAAQGWAVGLVYQAADAAADSSKASARAESVWAQAASLRQAMEQAAQKLPLPANYRLCDYLLLAPGLRGTAVQSYEALVLEQGCGRTSASVQACSVGCAELAALAQQQKQQYEAGGQTPQLASQLLQCLQQGQSVAPYLYRQQTGAGLLLPLICLQNQQPQLSGQAVLLQKQGGQRTLAQNQAQAAWLLAGQGGQKEFWLQGAKLTVRRCVRSVTAMADGSFTVYLDCIGPQGAAAPTAAQCAQLQALCLQTVRTLWRQGVDVLALRAAAVQRYGPGAARSPQSGPCPALQLQLRFSRLF